MPKQISAMTKRAVRGSRTGRPIMALLDLLGRRWTLRILWELREQRADLARAARGLRRGVATVLQARLAELREAGFVELMPGSGYRLTETGPGVARTPSCRCTALRSGGSAIVVLANAVSDNHRLQ